MFVYCNNQPITNADYSGESTIVIIYDGRTSGVLFGHKGGKGFSKQSQLMRDRCLQNGDSVIMLPYYSMGGFVNQWNSLGDRDDIDQIIIMSHGYPGGLSCSGEVLKDRGGNYSFSDLSDVKVSEFVLLLSCNGGRKPDSGLSVAEHIVTHTHSPVIASTAGVIYTWTTGKPYTKGMWIIYRPQIGGNYYSNRNETA